MSVVARAYASGALPENQMEFAKQAVKSRRMIRSPLLPANPMRMSASHNWSILCFYIPGKSFPCIPISDARSAYLL